MYRVNQKLWLLFLISALIGYTVMLDFTDPITATWHLFPDADQPSPTEAYGVKAAMLAMEGAAVLFIALIPAGTSRSARIADRWGRLAGVVAAGLTGWFWFLDATDGDYAPYLVAVVPSMIMCVLFVGLSTALSVASNIDQRLKQEHGGPRWGWEGVALIAVTLAVFLIAFAALILLSP